MFFKYNERFILLSINAIYRTSYNTLSSKYFGRKQIVECNLQYSPVRLLNKCLEQDDVHFLQRMYERLYPGHDCVVPTSYRTCNLIRMGNEMFGNINSRHIRNAMIMANWRNIDGHIVADDNIDVVPGAIGLLVVHNPLIDGTCRQHILLKVRYVPTIASS